jgi:hypothetical protein
LGETLNLHFGDVLWFGGEKVYDLMEQIVKEARELFK